MFRPDPDGALAWIVPACVIDPWSEEIESADPTTVISGIGGGVVDLVAFNPNHRGALARRTGLASVLGAIEPQLFDPNPVPVFGDVVGWLHNHCRGLVILTRHRYEAGRILRRLAVIEPESELHAAAISQLMQLPPYPLPNRGSRRLAMGGSHER
jgi:hypothetical protein